MTLENSKNFEKGNGKAHNDNAFKDLAILQRSLIGQKLICRVWSDTGEKSTPKVLAKKTIKFGQSDFKTKIGGKDRFYKVNYETKGVIKQDGGKLFYDTHFSNTVGALSFYEFPEAMDSDQAYTVFRNNAVDMYVKKGGIPFLYLALAMIGIIVMAIAFIATVPQALQAQEQVKELDIQVTGLKATNQALQQQNNELQNRLNLDG